MKITQPFAKFSHYISTLSGRPSAAILASTMVLLWLITGPYYGYSDTWQLVMNTTSSIVTFIMVFLIQNTQNRDSNALQIKLDELIRAHEGAHNALLDLEELTQEQLDAIKEKYEHLAKVARADLKHGLSDTETSAV
ncbi:MAG: low affinity iron permease family protein [Alphaproteobacteria bacterium]|jgi:low affinity Fe/Cu permease|nr:low affinity iron permease family protein [Alphaproteobacteria bacterium]